MFAPTGALFKEGKEVEINNNSKEINYGQIMKSLKRKLVVIPQLEPQRQKVCIEALGWYTAYLQEKFPEFSISQIREIISVELLSLELSLDRIRELQSRRDGGRA